MTTCYVGVGSNVGDRTGFCRRAVELLAETPEVRLLRSSSLYETSPVGGPPQRSFVNLVVQIDTTLGPRELLDVCKAIERRLGREPGDVRWGPRVADLDILLYGTEKVSEEGLEIPHPRLTQRAFALVPLLEIDPRATDPWGDRLDGRLDEAEGAVELLEPPGAP
jgi:2-amino-4-hydroxy-6-hydroxymethyldihydropteridine diphosphokinase